MMQVIARHNCDANTAMHVEDLLAFDVRHTAHVRQNGFFNDTATTEIYTANKYCEFITTKPRDHIVLPDTSL